MGVVAVAHERSPSAGIASCVRSQSDGAAQMDVLMPLSCLWLDAATIEVKST